MIWWSGTARRLFFAFASLFAIFGIASLSAMAGLSDVHENLHKVKEQEEAVRTALELTSAVRDQYAHQAHTIILGNDSHLPLYDEAWRRVAQLTREIRAYVHEPQQVAWLEDIISATAELDRIFRGEILPAVRKGDSEAIRREHARAQEMVSRIQNRTDALATAFETSIVNFESHSRLIEHRTVWWTLVLLIGAMVFAIGVAIYIVRSIMRPLALLEQGAARLAKGDLDTRIQIDRPDEFGRLARQFNGMTAALKSHQAERVEHEKLAGIGRLAAGVAHEINNPLGVILGYVRVMRKKAEGGLADDLKVIEDEAVRCQEIVEGLLDLSRPMKQEREPVDLREICDEIIQRLNESTAGSASRISIEGHGQVLGNPHRLRQVVLNMIKNATEAAGAEGKVTVVIDQHDHQVRLSVTDTGPGISVANRERLFEPFFTTKASGTGLGLAVSRAIARAHGGEIEADIPPGGGAVFTLRLPVTPEQERPDR